MTPAGCPGFLAGGVAVGLKKNNALDLALLVSESTATVAGVFTRNRVQAAPVKLSRRRAASGRGRAVIVNSGNANCCTGPRGLMDASAMARSAAEALGIPEDVVFTASTGVIGKPMDLPRVQAGIPELISRLRPDGFEDLARAIMTTDTEPKVRVVKRPVHDRTVTLCGVAKGAGMIRPDMATMLCFVATDAGAEPEVLQGLLENSVNRSFNRITIDGDTSTNDTVLLLANGQSGVGLTDSEAREAFASGLDELLTDLARWIVRDGEGVTKVVDVRVVGAASRSDAERLVETIAHSPLVKTAIHGEDANWGRILAAAGRAGVDLDPEAMDLYFGDVLMVKSGVGCGAAAETEATRVMRTAEYGITLDLNAGSHAAVLITCDFSVDYVKINADYRS
ncbi:MAG: bifunctional glutamate N-acetyltransferase/amino-acid acetyltransferase ArgJ [Desulfobacterales bacterium]